MAARDNPLRKLAEAIERLAGTLNSDNPLIKVSDVVEFCRLSSSSIFFLGIAFKFADLELQTKVSTIEFNYDLRYLAASNMFLCYNFFFFFFFFFYNER